MMSRAAIIDYLSTSLTDQGLHELLTIIFTLPQRVEFCQGTEYLQVAEGSLHYH